MKTPDLSVGIDKLGTDNLPSSLTNELLEELPQEEAWAQLELRVRRHISAQCADNSVQ